MTFPLPAPAHPSASTSLGARARLFGRCARLVPCPPCQRPRPWPQWLLRLPRPTLATHSSGASIASTAAKLHDEALATAKTMEEEATSLRTTNAERKQQLQEEGGLKSAAAAQECVRATADALSKERA